jgi:hypothetical protein
MNRSSERGDAVLFGNHRVNAYFTGIATFEQASV